MGLLNQTQQSYYSGDDYGGYQYIELRDVIDNFMATYIGEDKILTNTRRSDVSFHAHRALAELSYDTLRSCKSQEIEVCPNLKMPLPHDYVNYVKLTSVDSAGIEHVIYPTSKTSNPFAIEQIQDDCEDCDDTANTYQYEEGDLKPQEAECGTEDVTCTFSSTGLSSYLGNLTIGAGKVRNYVNDKIANGGWSIYQGYHYWVKWIGLVDKYCLCLQRTEAETNCGEQLSWGLSDDGYTPDPLVNNRNGGFDGIGTNNVYHELNIAGGWSNFRVHHLADPQPAINRDVAALGTWEAITTEVTTSAPTSNAWTNYKGSTPSENQVNDDYKDDTYWPIAGNRYGLDPQNAQINGSYFIDCLRGMIHFSSNLSGKTIILKYISDHLGKNDEMLVPKLAEEAIYKHIMCGCLSAKLNVPEYVVNRFKRERFAETRKAKLRLSNIKLEEITQTLRGKSKQIKH